MIFHSDGYGVKLDSFRSRLSPGAIKHMNVTGYVPNIGQRRGRRLLSSLTVIKKTTPASGQAFVSYTERVRLSHVYVVSERRIFLLLPDVPPPELEGRFSS